MNHAAHNLEVARLAYAHDLCELAEHIGTHREWVARDEVKKSSRNLDRAIAIANRRS